MRNTFLFLLFALTASGCQPVMFLAYGIRKPREVSDEKIERQAERLAIAPDHVATIQPAQFLKCLQRVESFPNLLIFDPQGNRYNAKSDPETCKGNVSDYIRSLKGGEPFDAPADGLQDSLRLWLEPQPTQEEKAAPNYYAYVFWATWLGRMNRLYLPEWQRAVRENQAVNIRLIYVNCDMRKSWPAGYEKLWAPQGRK